jgi:hypothetical protein
VVVDLGHGGAEAPLQLRLNGEELFALPLQLAVLGEVKLERKNPYVTGAQGCFLRRGFMGNPGFPMLREDADVAGAHRGTRLLRPARLRRARRRSR